jgi:hypothetical protein
LVLILGDRWEKDVDADLLFFVIQGYSFNTVEWVYKRMSRNSRMLRRSRGKNV